MNKRTHPIEKLQEYCPGFRLKRLEGNIAYLGDAEVVSQLVEIQCQRMQGDEDELDESTWRIMDPTTLIAVYYGDKLYHLVAIGGFFGDNQGVHIIVESTRDVHVDASME